MNADVLEIDVTLPEERDEHVIRLGISGIGGIGIPGVAAMANAVYDATGLRIRKLAMNLVA